MVMTKLRLIFKFILFMGVLSVLVYRFWPMPALAPGVVADRIVITKHQRQMTLFNGAKILKHYQVAMGADSDLEQGKKSLITPEGSYQIDVKKEDGEHYRVMHLARTSETKHDGARETDLQNPGGVLMIRGQNQAWQWLGRLHCLADCSAGCVTLRNAEMDELWRAVPVGVKVEIKP
jgi:murein L,D-transpeptidase YafK